MSQCGRDPDEHCCWLVGIPCPYLKRTTRKVQKNDGFFWACKLREELGSWEAVHEDRRYLKNVHPEWEKRGIRNCGDWPEGRPRGGDCSVCGAKGDEDVIVVQDLVND